MDQDSEASPDTLPIAVTDNAEVRLRTTSRAPDPDELRRKEQTRLSQRLNLPISADYRPRTSSKPLDPGDQYRSPPSSTSPLAGKTPTPPPAGC